MFGTAVLRSLILAAVPLVFESCWQGTTREVSSSILFVDGQPALDHGSRGKLLPLTAASPPSRGDTIETPGTARVGLSLLPNLLVLLDRDARMEIVRLTLTKDGNETGPDMRGRFAEVKLSRGRMFVSHSQGDSSARFSLITAEGEITTSSNALFIIQSEQQKTRVTCVGGWVEFRPSGATTAVQVPPGSVGQWPAPASNLTKAEADPAAQEDLQQAIEIERELRALAVQRRNVLPR